MQYSTGKYCVFYHRYHLVWSIKYRYKVLQGDIKLRVRDICRQVCAQNGVEIIRGVLSSDHVHMFVSVPPKLAISDLMRLMKAGHLTKCNANSRISKSATGAGGFGGTGIFQQPTALLPKTSYFSTLNSTSPILPTTVGSGLVIPLKEQSQPTGAGAVHRSFCRQIVRHIQIDIQFSIAIGIHRKIGVNVV